MHNVAAIQLNQSEIELLLESLDAVLVKEINNAMIDTMLTAALLPRGEARDQMLENDKRKLKESQENAKLLTERVTILQAKLFQYKRGEFV